MVELVALVGHRHRVDDLAEGRRARLHVDDRESVGFGEIRAKQQRIGEILRWSLHCELRRCVKGWIRPHCHRSFSLEAHDCLVSWACVAEQAKLSTAKRTYWYSEISRRLYNGVCSSSVRRRCQSATLSDRTGLSSSGTSSLAPPTDRTGR